MEIDKTTDNKGLNEQIEHEDTGYKMKSEYCGNVLCEYCDSDGCVCVRERERPDGEKSCLFYYSTRLYVRK